MPRLWSPDELSTLEDHLDRWLASQLRTNPIVAAVERDPTRERRWYVRLVGEEKDSFTIRFELRQRTLFYETFFMPAPEENEADLYRHLLRRNAKLFGAAFTIGEEDAMFLQGHLDNGLIGVESSHSSAPDTIDPELDRILGSLYVWVEQFFRPAMRIGFASKFSR